MRPGAGVECWYLATGRYLLELRPHCRLPPGDRAIAGCVAAGQFGAQAGDVRAGSHRAPTLRVDELLDDDVRAERHACPGPGMVTALRGLPLILRIGLVGGSWAVDVRHDGQSDPERALDVRDHPMERLLPR